MIESRNFFLEKKYPSLCKVLENYKKFFSNDSTCQNWPDTLFDQIDNGDFDNLTKEVNGYAKDNLALIHIFIQNPFVTKIKRDESMTVTNYVGNTGGLLGLCLGFSFISAVELVLWFFICIKKSFKTCF